MFSKRVWILSYWLCIAEELQVKGLIGKTDEKVEKSLSSTFSPAKIPKTAVHRQALNRNIHNLGENGTLAIPGNNSGDFEELDNEVNSMMLKSQNRSANGHQFADICKVCGKEGHVRDIRNHIEANHLEGVVIPYNLCDKTFRSRNSFRTHKSRQHTNKFACSQNWFKFKLLKPLWWSFWVQKCFEMS